MPSCFTKRTLEIWTMTDNVSGKRRVGVDRGDRVVT